MVACVLLALLLLLLLYPSYTQRTVCVNLRPASKLQLDCTPTMHCSMQCINWLDLGRDTVPTWLANAITERWFFPALVKRLRRYTEQHGLAAPGAWAA